MKGDILFQSDIFFRFRFFRFHFFRFFFLFSAKLVRTISFLSFQIGAFIIFHVWWNKEKKTTGRFKNLRFPSNAASMFFEVSTV
jgi:hypothetical protein